MTTKARSDRSGRKQSVYWTPELIDEITAESKRIGRPLSWVVQECVRRAMPKLATLISPDSLLPSPEGEDR